MTLLCNVHVDMMLTFGDAWSFFSSLAFQRQLAWARSTIKRRVGAGDHLIELQTCSRLLQPLDPAGKGCSALDFSVLASNCLDFWERKPCPIS